MFTSKQPPMPDTVCVATVFNPVERGIIQDLLSQSGIPNLTRPKYGLDPLPVLAGFSVMGEEIYVRADQEAEAREIIDAFLNEGSTPVPGDTDMDPLPEGVIPETEDDA